MTDDEISEDEAFQLILSCVEQGQNVIKEDGIDAELYFIVKDFLAEPTVDASILSAFKKWVQAVKKWHALTPAPDDDPAWTAAGDQERELRNAIADMPAEGVTGLAIKLYLAAHAEHGWRGVHPSPFHVPLDAHDDDSAYIMESVYCDAFRLVPELGALTGEAPIWE